MRVVFGFGCSAAGSASVSAELLSTSITFGSGWMLEGFRYITDIGGISTAIELDLPCIAIFSERMISFSGMPLPP